MYVPAGAVALGLYVENNTDMMGISNDELVSATVSLETHYELSSANSTESPDLLRVDVYSQFTSLDTLTSSMVAPFVVAADGTRIPSTAVSFYATPEGDPSGSNFYAEFMFTATAGDVGIGLFIDRYDSGVMYTVEDEEIVALGSLAPSFEIKPGAAADTYEIVVQRSVYGEDAGTLNSAGYKLFTVAADGTRSVGDPLDGFTAATSEDSGDFVATVTLTGTQEGFGVFLDTPENGGVLDQIDPSEIIVENNTSDFNDRFDIISLDTAGDIDYFRLYVKASTATETSLDSADFKIYGQSSGGEKVTLDPTGLSGFVSTQNVIKIGSDDVSVLEAGRTYAIT